MTVHYDSSLGVETVLNNYKEQWLFEFRFHNNEDSPIYNISIKDCPGIYKTKNIIEILSPDETISSLLVFYRCQAKYNYTIEYEYPRGVFCYDFGGFEFPKWAWPAKKHFEKKDKKDQVLKLVFGDNNIEILNK